MSSGFVPAGTILPPTAPPEDATDAAWAAARAAVSSSTSAPTPSSAPEDTRSLYDILQSNKARKQEEFEEKLKFKNQFRALDEGDVEFLDSVLDGQRRLEAERRRAVEGEVERFREMQQVVEVAEEVEEEGEKWGKRRRGEKRRSIAGVKVKRKGEEGEEGGKKRKIEEVKKEGMKEGMKEGKAEKKVESEAAEKKGTEENRTGNAEEKKVEVLPPEPKVEVKAPVVAAVLGLDYGSDDDDD